MPLECLWISLRIFCLIFVPNVLLHFRDILRYKIVNVDFVVHEFSGRVMNKGIFEPVHEIMALFVFRKLVLQTRQWGWMSDVWSDALSTPILHVCKQRKLWRHRRPAKVQASLRNRAVSPESSLVAYVISTIISRDGSFTHIRLASHFWDTGKQYRTRRLSRVFTVC